MGFIICLIYRYNCRDCRFLINTHWVNESTKETWYSILGQLNSVSWAQRLGQVVESRLIWQLRYSFRLGVIRIFTRLRFVEVWLVGHLCRSLVKCRFLGPQKSPWSQFPGDEAWESVILTSSEVISDSKLENRRAKYQLTLQFCSLGTSWDKEVKFVRQDSLTSCKNSTYFACYTPGFHKSYSHPLRLSPRIPGSTLKPPVKVMEVKDHRFLYQLTQRQI